MPILIVYELMLRYYTIHIEDENVSQYKQTKET